MTADRRFKEVVRARMESTGENYTTARRAIIHERNLAMTDQPIEPVGDVHYAPHRGAPEAACGANLRIPGAAFRTFPDAGVTCGACQQNFPAPDPTA